MESLVYVRTLARAAYLVGGVDSLAYELGITPEDLADFLALRRSPPMDVFLRAVDIVVEEATRPEVILKGSRHDSPPV